MLSIRDNDMAIRELAHFNLNGHTLTRRENSRVIVNNDQINRLYTELDRERERTLRVEQEAKIERERTRHVEDELEGERRKEACRQLAKQRETSMKLEVAALELDIAAHRLIATTTRAPWRGLVALGRGRACDSTKSTASPTTATPTTSPPSQAATPQSTPPQPPTTTTTTTSDDEETGEEFSDISIALSSHF